MATLRLLENQNAPVDGPHPAEDVYRRQQLEKADNDLALVLSLSFTDARSCYGADPGKDDVQCEDYVGNDIVHDGHVYS